MFSVAQHSVFVEAIATQVYPDLKPQERLGILLHDAAEYVIGDIISPFKAVLGGNYREVESRLMHAIHTRFSLGNGPTTALQTLTKKMDRQAAFHEAITLAGFAIKEAEAIFGPAERLPKSLMIFLQPLTANEAKLQFLKQFAALDQS